MSIKVELAEFEDKATEYGDGFLLTCGTSPGPHAMHVLLAYTVGDEGVTASCEVGRTALANIGANPNVTLLWAPVSAGGYSLIADGLAQASGERSVSIQITSAVLHRPAE